MPDAVPVPTHICNVFDASTSGSLSGTYTRTSNSADTYVQTDEYTGNQIFCNAGTCSFLQFNPATTVRCTKTLKDAPIDSPDGCAEWERFLFISCHNEMRKEVESIDISDPNTQTNSNASELSEAWIIFIVGMGVFAVALVIIGVWFMRKRNAIKATFEHQEEEEQEEEEEEEEAAKETAVTAQIEA